MEEFPINVGKTTLNISENDGDQNVCESGNIAVDSNEENDTMEEKGTFECDIHSEQPHFSEKSTVLPTEVKKSLINIEQSNGTEKSNFLPQENNDKQNSDAIRKVQTAIKNTSISQEQCIQKGDLGEVGSVTRNKRLILMDSDSDSEQNKSDNPNHASLESQKNPTLQMDEEICQTSATDSANLHELSNGGLKQNMLRKKKHFNIIDSDSDSEDTTEVQLEKNNDAETFVMNSKGELISENPIRNTMKNTWTALCDSESSEEERDGTQEMHQENENELVEDLHVTSPQKYRNKSKSKNTADQPKKMTGRDALRLRREIQSESQRMIRESKVSLPYHKPKQFSLKEFLTRRPKLASGLTVNANVSASVAIKIQKDQLETISKILEEREKEVKEFYKSDSGSDDDDINDPEYVPENELTQEEKDDIQEQKEQTENENPTDQNKETDSVETNAHIESNKLVINNCTVPDESNEINENDHVSCAGEEIVNVGPITQNNEEAEHEPNTLSEQLEDESVKVSTETSEISLVEAMDCEKDLNNDKVEDVEKNDKEMCSNEECSKLENLNDSNDFDFNLDDLEENEVIKSPSGVNVSEERVEKLKESVQEKTNNTNLNLAHDDDNRNIKEHTGSSYKNDELDKEIEAFGNKSIENEKKLNILDLVKAKLGKTQPKLSGTPNGVIDLVSDNGKPKEIASLIERFEKHTAKQNFNKHKVHLNIVSVESQGHIEKEVVSMEIDDDNSMGIEEKPGTRIRKLRDELQDQIVKRKSELWQNKIKKTNEMTNEESCRDNSKSDYEDDVDEILDNEDEEELSESSEEEELEEDIETDSTKKKKSAFIDQEAEESDIEDELIHEDNDEMSADSDKENRIIEEDMEENSQSSNISETNLETEPDKKKPLRRILKGFTEDSDDEDDSIITQTKINSDQQKSIEKLNDDDDAITPHQKRITETQKTAEKINSQETQNSFSFDFLTPVSYITGIRNLTVSATKSVKDSPPAGSPLRISNNPNIPSPLKEVDWESSLQKKLFSDNVISDSQAIAEICSGDFPTTQSIVENVIEDRQPETYLDQTNSFPSTAPSTQDLLNVCSGNFSGTLQTSSGNCGEKVDIINKQSYETTDETDVIISQLLDEEEMENFKKKFESPGTKNSQTLSEDVTDDVEVKTYGIIDSDDEETDEMKVKTKKNKAKLTFSDDSSDDSENEKEDEEIDLHDEDDDVDCEDENNDIMYDSEENEIEVTADEHEERTEGTSSKLKSSDFFENEAELSESDWDSADEDEKDLDALEEEAGDSEKYDEKKLKTDLERIHMRRMLDDDQREVKLLQELLLEDGELHGSGRARQFKWKNVDVVEAEDEDKKMEDDIYFDDDESEEQWRKKRHEREMFLKEKQKNKDLVDEDDLLSNSQILKIGQKVLEKSISINKSLPNTLVENDDDEIVKSSFFAQNKRGSFLSRGDEVLQRLSAFNKVTETVVVGATAKNSRKFLFQTVSAQEKSLTVIQGKKRTATDGTPNVLKKLRLSENFSPASRKTKPANPKVKAKLF